MRAPLLAVAVFLLLVAGSARAPLGDSMAAPAWTPGDYWVYHFNSTFEDTVFLDGTLRADIVEVRTVTVRGVTQDAFIVAIGGSGTLTGRFLGTVPASGLWNLTGEQMFSVAGRTIVRNLIAIDAAGVALLDVPFTLQWTNTTSSRVVVSAWTYPVPLGHSSDITMNSSFVEDAVLQFGADPPYVFSNSTESEYAFRVSLDAATGNADVPAGAFETFRVTEAWPDATSERFEYAPAAGNNARTVAYNASGGPVSSTELLEYRYRAGEPPANGSGFLLIGAGVAVAIAAALAACVWLRRRRRREDAYTPPSLRDPPT